MTQLYRLCAVGQRVVGNAADLYVIAIRIGHVQAVEAAVAHVFNAERFQLGLRTLAVEIGDRVAHMFDQGPALAAGRSSTLRRSVQVTRTDDEAGERHIIRGDAEGLLALFPERERDVDLRSANLVEIEHFRI